MTSINAVKLALEALENASPAAWASRVDSDTMKSIWRKHAGALEGLQVLLAELDNASCKSVQKRLEAQQPATGEPLGFTYQAEIAYADSTGGNGSFWRVPPDLDDEAVPLYTHPAPSVPGDVVRVPLQVLKDASEALGNFVSDHGWGDTDMQAMDNLDAYIARHEANRAAILAAK